MSKKMHWATPSNSNSQSCPEVSLPMSWEADRENIIRARNERMRAANKKQEEKEEGIFFTCCAIYVAAVIYGLFAAAPYFGGLWGIC